MIPPPDGETLSWLSQNPADCAVLFNKKRDPNAQDSAKPHARRKKEIHVVIAKVVFTQDIYYGEVYASQPAKFASAVGSHLMSYVISFSILRIAYIYAIV